MSLKKAEEFLSAADACLRLGYLNASASRSYYALFHAASYALEVAGVDRESWTHEGLHSALARELIRRRKKLPGSFARMMPDCMAVRLEADYRHTDVSARVARRVLKIAEEFVRKVKEGDSS